MLFRSCFAGAGRKVEVAKNFSGQRPRSSQFPPHFGWITLSPELGLMAHVLVVGMAETMRVHFEVPPASGQLTGAEQLPGFKRNGLGIELEVELLKQFEEAQELRVRICVPRSGPAD